jgi:hypothetical protein
MSDETFALCWLQTMGGGGDVLRRDIPAAQALTVLAREQAKALQGEYGAGVVVYLRPSSDHALSEEVATAAADLATVEQLRTELAAAKRLLETTWRLLGRCDMAFELISTNQTLTTARRTARQMREEIKKASGG